MSEELFGMDRRSFLKGSALSALGLAGASMFAAAPAMADEAEAVVYTPEDTADCDILVVGCGASGFMAALTAAKAGKNVIAIDKFDDCGEQNGLWVSGPFAVDTQVLHERDGGTTLEVDEVFQHAMDYWHWTPNPSLVKRCLTESKNAVQNLLDIGYEFMEANFRFETPFKEEKGGFHLILTDIPTRAEMWKQAFVDYAIDARWSSEMKDLIVDEAGAVVGAYVDCAGVMTQINAKAVILAGGGYLANRDLQERFLHTRKLNVAHGGLNLCTGDTILAAERIGAALDKTYGYCPCEYGGTNTKASRPANQDKFDQNFAFRFGILGNLLVDAQGKRFLNEGLLCDYPMSYGSEQILKNSPWFSVVDQAFVDACTPAGGFYEYTAAKGATDENWFIGRYYSSKDWSTLPQDLEEGIAEGWCFKADTIEELATFFNLENLPATVEQYNAYCEAGVDEQFGASPWYLSPLTTPPFYVIENEPSAWSTFGGYRIDDCCRVCTIDNLPIAGLYGAGTDCGSLYCSPYSDIPGWCYGMAIDSGYIAATEAAAAIA